MDYSKKPTYFFAVDALRVISILAVVLIHVTTKTLANLDHNVIDGSISLFLNQASRFAVPLFFLISGFVLELNNKDIPYSLYVKKRASRVFIPFVFWSLLYFYIAWGGNIQKIFSLEFLGILISGKASYHLYFIPALVVFYIAFPFLHKLLFLMQKPAFLISVWALQFSLLFIDYYNKPLEINSTIRIVLLVFAMFVTGIVASHLKEKILKTAEKFFFPFSALAIILSGIIFFHVVELTIVRKTTSFIYNQHGPLNYVYSILLTMVGLHFFEKTRFFERGIKTLSQLSFFVFFIHVLILNSVWNYFLRDRILQSNPEVIKQFWFDPLFFTAISLISFGIAYLVHKIPYAAKITG